MLAPRAKQVWMYLWGPVGTALWAEVYFPGTRSMLWSEGIGAIACPLEFAHFLSGFDGRSHY